MNLATLMDAASELIAMHEAAKTGLKHARHAKHLVPARARMVAVLRAYWARQEAALLREIRPRIERALETMPSKLQESTPDGKRFAQNLLPSSLSPLRFAVTKAEADEFGAAIESAVLGAAKTIAAQLDIAADGESFAARYLRENSLSKLTGNFADTTVERLQGALADAWDKGGSYDQMVSAIKDTFADFSDSRAAMIAQTESSDAYNATRESIALEAGLDEHAWETESGDPCQICLDNEDEDYIDIDEDFSSGDSAPPAHPNCECLVNFRKSTA
jgi:hypothetical protein